MPTEAQRLISVSLTKIAHSRAQRGGVSLHKNLLVATVLQKARYIFMEEAYHMVQIHSMQPRQQYQHHPQLQQQQQHQQQQQQQQQQHHHHHHQQQQQLHHHQQQQHQLEHEEYEEDNLVALTAEEAGIRDQATTEDSASESSEDVLPPPPCDRCADPSATTPTDDKENHLPQSDVYTPVDCPTYLDLDKDDNILRERTNSAVTCASTKCLKRRRVTEWETEEAVTSILPKRVKSCCDISSTTASSDESVFLDESLQDKQGDGESSMEIDRITSLVSIFSFGGLGGDAGIGKLARSVSTPDLCSAQANEGVDSLQQRSFLAMTV